MKTYRNSNQIIYDLLVKTDESGQEGIKTTSLLSKSNLSQGKNSFSILAKSMKQITVSEIIKYINK